MRIITTFVFITTLASGAFGSDIARVTVSPAATAIKLVPANQFVVCDTCPATTHLTLLKTPVPAPMPAMRFTQLSPSTNVEIPKPQEVAEKLAVVYFRLNRDDLKGGEKTKLLSVVNKLKLADNLRVKGYTCDLGSKAYNNRLALRRAETVKRYLRSIGVTEARIEISGEGLCCYSSHNRANNRRVEIITKGPQ
jgi:hypothetical protein